MKDQKGAEKIAEFNNYATTLVPIAMMYYNIWDQYTEYFPFSHGPACATPDDAVFAGAKPCRHEQLFDDKCDWECFHKACEYDFFGNDGTNSSYTEWDNHCGKPIFAPSEAETMLQFEVNNYNGKTPVPDMDEVQVPNVRNSWWVEQRGKITICLESESQENICVTSQR